jgi:bifunctional non-homologous end joining protein LigD
MLAREAADQPRHGDWFAEIKWDGWRCLAYLDLGDLRILSRGGSELADRLPELAPAARALAGERLILDGELVAFDQRGRPSFEALQRRMQRRRPGPGQAPVALLVFDLLWHGATSLLDRPYTDRRAALEAVARLMGFA